MLCFRPASAGLVLHLDMSQVAFMARFTGKRVSFSDSLQPQYNVSLTATTFNFPVWQCNRPRSSHAVVELVVADLANHSVMSFLDVLQH